MIRHHFGNSMLLLALFFSVISFGQTRKERKADREFDTYAYVEAIKVYESMAEKGYVNTSILSKLGDSYYFNGKFTDAYKWYDQLFNGSYEGKDLNLLNSEYYYRFGQTLKAVGQPQQADEILKRFGEIEIADSRFRLFLTSDEISQATQATSSFSLINLGVNSPYSDYGATILQNQLIFTSSRENHQMINKRHNWTNEYYAKLYASTILEDGTLEEPVLFAKEIASKELNMGTAIFTKDGNTMYFTSNDRTRNNRTRNGKRAKYDQNEPSLLKIYKAHMQEDGRWGSVEELPFNLEGYNTAHPALTPDEKWMYFASDRQGGLDQLDLFRVPLYDMGEFGSIENLGEKINTSGRETFPFISSSYMLYFSTDGHPGFGGLDLYKSKINSDGSLGIAINLGPDINSRFDDFGFYLDDATQKGFFTSNRVSGQGGDDIYLFVEKPCIQIIDGLISDKDSQFAISKVEIIVFDRMQQQIDVVYADNQGYYRSNKLLCGQKYRIRVSKEGYLTQEFVVETDRKAQIRIDIELESANTKIETGDDLFKKLKLSPIYFDFDKSEIRADAQIELMKVVEVMLQYPELKLAIRSHTDSRGNDAYNLRLSERRAQSTVQWMIRQGIDASRLTGKGYGESQLLNACSNGVRCTDQEHQVNRRSEFIIVNK
ncbi:OmpA family protein [Myroides odoratus]|uniref:OmpA family protein n=1 Tax=Myroides odoratus TaxID=256 RepID=UPI0039B101EE